MIGEWVFLKCERLRPFLLMELWPEAAPPSSKHGEYWTNPFLKKGLRDVWSNPSWVTQIPTDWIFLTIHMHIEMSPLCKKNTNVSSQWSVFTLWRASFLLMTRSVLPSSVSWPQESFLYSYTWWHFQQARPEDIFVSVCGLWESKLITKNVQQS